jgi:hypothetical protein
MKARRTKIHQHLPAQLQALVDLEAVVDIRSLIGPFHPIIVRGFSRYERINSSSSGFSGTNGYRLGIAEDEANNSTFVKQG